MRLRALVGDLIGAVRVRGTGATAQPASFERSGDLRAVVLDAVDDVSGRSGQPGSVLVTRDESAGYLRATMVAG